MRRPFFLLPASLGLLAAFACSSLSENNFEETVFDEGELVERVIFEAPVIRSLGEDDETRASLSQDGEGSIRFAWEASDTVGIFPDKGSQVFFEMTNGVGTNVASFDGGGWALKQKSTYSCYYPFVGDFYLDRNAIPVSFTDQVQAGVSDYSGVNFYLASEGTSSSEGALRFTFQMLNTVIRIKALGLPAGTYTKMSISTDEPLFVQEGTFGLEDMTITGKTYSNTLDVALNDFTLTEASTEANPVLIYLTSAPVDLRGHKVIVRVYSDDDSIYGCEKNPGKAYEAGAWGGLMCTMEEVDIITFIDPEVKRICVENWDTDGNGELDIAEAAAVASLGSVFSHNTLIMSFDELQFFTGLAEIGAYDFSGCSNLTGLTIPENVTSIGYGAFLYCDGLSSITIPESVTTIEDDAFCRSGITSIHIPESVVYLGNYAFTNCERLAEFSGKYASPDGHFLYNNGVLISFAPVGITSYTIPDYVTTIGNSAFYYSVMLSSVMIPNSVTSIGVSAFAATGLTSVVIPSSVTSIGVNAFGSCWAMRSITIEAIIPPTTDGWLFDTSYDFVIYVPAASVEAYKTAGGWSEYADRIQAIPE